MLTKPSPSKRNYKHYPCEFCGKLFDRPSKLAIHYRKHTKERPYECQVCGRTFSIKGNLTKHVKTSHGPDPNPYPNDPNNPNILAPEVKLNNPEISNNPNILPSDFSNNPNLANLANLANFPNIMEPEVQLDDPNNTSNNPEVKFESST